MLSGGTVSASEIAGTAVFRIVVSSDSMKNATATSHGRSRLLEADGVDETGGELVELTGLMAMESKNYFTNEWKDLLEFATPKQITPLTCFRAPNRPVPLAIPVITCTKTPLRALSPSPVLATIKRT